MLEPPKSAEAFPLGPPLDPIAPLRVALRGHYEIGRELGHGAFATVFLARDLKHERTVALKVLNADPTSETGELRFIREIRVLAKLQHPNILPLHDSGHVEALLYYVMPYVSGETLRDRILRERQLPIEDACTIAREVADALAYAHDQGIIHRDIKPENILLSATHAIVADFGIARAIDLAGVRQLTRTGTQSPGTPAYMSPEQLLNDREIDVRSDIYSVGCVLYEMLTGHPPFSGKDGFVRRFTEAPPLPSAARADVPSRIDTIIMKSMARDRNDRYPTAKELVASLGRIDSASRLEEHRDAVRDKNHANRPIAYSPRPAANESGLKSWSNPSVHARAEYAPRTGPLRRWSRLMPARVTAAGILAAAVALMFFTSPRLRRAITRAPGIDAGLLAVLPLTEVAPASAGVGAVVSAGLHDAFSRWDDLPLVTDTRVSQAASNRGASPRTEEDAFALARALGAGKVVWGQVSGANGAVSVRAHLYDVATKKSIEEIRLRGSAEDEGFYRRLSTELLKPAGRAPAADGGDGLTKSYPAWSAYALGHSALAKWDLDQAEQQFSAALVADPNFAPAHLWLAQIRAWEHPEARSGWQDHAARSVVALQRLSPRDQRLAQALVALGDQSYPTACRRYRDLTVMDSADFAGWYGLGECQALDSLVVPAPGSPSRWFFRSSNRSAALAYQRAIRLSPGARTIFRFAKLQSLLPTAATKVRFGNSAPPQRIEFMASPSLMVAADTLGFIPYPRAAFSDRPVAVNATLSAALAQNGEELLGYALSWTRDSGNDPAAYEALADVLEVRGSIGDESSPTASAISALRRVRSLTTDSSQRLRTVSKETWIRFKRGEFAAAKHLADEALASTPQPNAQDAAVLSGLAALTGRLARLTNLAELSQAAIPAGMNDLAAPVQASASAFFARAALGVCGTEVTTGRKELNDAIDHYVAPATTDRITQGILARPLSMLTPCTGGRSALEIASPRDRVTQMQQAYASGDKNRVRAISDTIAIRIRTRRPGDLSPDFTFQHAWLRAAIGDTAAAITQLDRSLGALPGLSGPALQEPGSAAAIIRAMILRADLAGKTHDSQAAQRWARAVATLWSDADAELRPTVIRMQVLAGKPTKQ